MTSQLSTLLLVGALVLAVVVMACSGSGGSRSFASNVVPTNVTGKSDTSGIGAGASLTAPGAAQAAATPTTTPTPAPGKP